jgi:hypothetical protein
VPAPDASRFSNQSVTPEEVLDAFQDLLGKATGFADRRVVEWHGGGRPEIDLGQSVVWFCHRSRRLDAASGAGRNGTRCDLVIEVNLTTRNFGDGSQRDKVIGRRHLGTQFLIENAFHNRMLHPAYDAIPADSAEPPKPSALRRPPPDDVEARRLTRAETPPPILTVATMVAEAIDAPDKTRPEQGYVETKIRITVPVVLRVTLKDAPDLEDAGSAPAPTTAGRPIVDPAGNAATRPTIWNLFGLFG